jgi:CRP-like cAMP-binding protein
MDIKDHNFKETARLLKLSPALRTAKDIETLMEVTAEVEFFKQLKDNYLTDELHRECVKCMTLENYRARAFVFNYGDTADNFYILLRGQISIQMPKSALNADKPDVQEDINPPDKEAVYQKPDDLETADILVEVKVRDEGTSFGELALITEQTRSAAIQCLRDCWVAKLSRGDFMRILKEYEENKIGGIVKFLKSIEIFRGWTRVSLQKVTYFFETRRYKLNQVVYRYDDPAEHIYIIKSGEFKFTCMTQEAAKTSVKRQGVIKTQLQMFIKGPGEVFGDDDIIEGRRRSLTCVCTSLVGEVMVMQRNDFLRKLKAPQTLDYLMARHKAEEEWRANRLEKLKFAEMLKKRLNVSPVQQKPCRPTRVLVRGLERHKTLSISPTKTKAIEAPSQEVPIMVNFFETEVEESFFRQEPSSAHNLPTEVHKDNKHQSRSPYRRNMSRACPRPPPNFFCSPKDAVISRYRLRPLITGRLEDSMSPVERSFHKKMSSKLRTQKNLSVGRSLSPFVDN